MTYLCTMYTLRATCKPHSICNVDFKRNVTMLRKQIIYKYHIYAHCRL